MKPRRAAWVFAERRVFWRVGNWSRTSRIWRRWSPPWRFRAAAQLNKSTSGIHRIRRRRVLPRPSALQQHIEQVVLEIDVAGQVFMVDAEEKGIREREKHIVG